jgi:hypothetical protein
MNEAMGTVAGGLIQMNAHMVVTNTALGLIIVGVSLATGLAISAFMWWLEAKKRWWMLAIFAVAFAALAVAGCRMPRVKEIHACADGPISLETVSAVYDIVNVDGKELTLRVR